MEHGYIPFIFSLQTFGIAHRWKASYFSDGMARHLCRKIQVVFSSVSLLVHYNSLFLIDLPLPSIFFHSYDMADLDCPYLSYLLWH